MNDTERWPAGRRRASSSLRKGVYVLPSLITTAGLFSGFYSVIASVRGDFFAAAVAILIANVFDILDGRVARLTNTTSRFGIEYDSLSDLIAFGVAPGILVYRWALEPWGSWGWLAASLYVTCGALRLARFNVQYETAEKRHFLGLPIPAAAEVIASAVLLYYYFGGEGVTHKHALAPPGDLRARRLDGQQHQVFQLQGNRAVPSPAVLDAGRRDHRPQAAGCRAANHAVRRLLALCVVGAVALGRETLAGRAAPSRSLAG